MSAQNKAPVRSTARAGRKVAVLIGINAYGGGIPRLRNAVRDVELLAGLLEGEHGYEVQRLLDEQASLPGLRTLLARLATGLGVDDRLILYFAGHGIAEELEDGADGPQGYLIPQDALRDDPATFLPMSEFQEQMSNLPCRHLLLLLDCCFAGAFRWSRTRSLAVRHGTLYRERYERYLRDSAWQVITSAAQDERALDTVAGGKLGSRAQEQGEYAGNSPFAAALCRGLRGAADLRVDGRPGDGIIVASELHLYLESAFERLEQQLCRALQKPLLWSLSGRDKGQFVFFVPGRQAVLPSALELSEANNPYRGLEPYEESNAALFFGRSQIVEQLRERVTAQPLVVVTGISGSGKSSLVRAGLLSRLRTQAGWQLLTPIRPGNRPLAVLEALEINDAQGARAADLATAVSTWRSRNPGVRLLLVVDQLEELITLGATSAEQQIFLQAIQEAVAVASGQLHVVCTLRADFEPHFAELLAPREGSQVRFLVRPLSRQELREAIEGPANERVLYFEPPMLVDQLIDEVAEMPGALPLLSFTLSEMYRAYVKSGRSDRSLSQADYQQLGGVAGALSQRADELFQSLDAAPQGTLRRVMLRMVALEAGEIARRRVPLTELRHGDDHPEEARVQAVLRQLLAARLVVSGRDSEGVAYVEPAHDKLVLGWRQLWSFIKAEQERLPLERRVTQATVDWERSGRTKDRLWDRDPRLPQAVAMQQETAERFNRLEGEFIDRSESRRRRQRVISIATIIGVMAILGISSVVAQLQRQAAVKASERATAAQKREEHEKQQARESEERAKHAAERARTEERKAKEAEERAIRAATVAEQERNRADEEAQNVKQQLLASYIEKGRQFVFESGQPSDGLLWLHRAQGEGSQDPALPYLLNSAVHAVGAPTAVLLGHAGSVFGATYSPDGRRILTRSEDNTARMWEADSGRFVTELKGHGAFVTSATYSPDGRHIVTASRDKTARVWEADSGRSVVELTGHRFTVWSARYGPDGRRIVTASQDQTARVWEADSGRSLVELKGHTDVVVDAMFSPDGQRVLTASDDGTARIWETDSGRLVAELKGHRFSINSARYSPDGRRIVTASSDGTARVWEADSGRFVVELKPLNGVIDAIFSPDGLRIVTVSQHKTARLWESDSGRLVAPLEGHKADITSAAYSPDGRHIVTSSRDMTVRVWEADKGKPVAEIKGHGHFVNSATYSPDGRHIATTSYDKTARVWQADSGRLVAELKGHKAFKMSEPYSGDGPTLLALRFLEDGSGRSIGQSERGAFGITSATYSPDGRRILTASADKTARVWKADSGSFLVELKGHGEAVLSATYSPDGRRILTASRDKTARVWEAESGRLIVELKGHGDGVFSATYSPDGRRILTASEDKTARIWESVSGRLLTELKGHEGRVNSAMYSPDGRRILTASEDKTARIWEAGSGRLVAELKGHVVDSATYSPDGLRIVTASEDKTARIWEAGSGRLVAELKGHGDAVYSATYSPDGRRIVTASRDKTARVWEADKGQVVAELRGHGGIVNRATYSPDGRFIATASRDKTVRIWEADSGRLVAELKGHEDAVDSVTYSPDGRRIVTASKDDTARVWALSENRAYEQLARFIRCHVPLKLDPANKNVVVAQKPTPDLCRDVLSHP